MQDALFKSKVALHYTFLTQNLCLKVLTTHFLIWYTKLQD
jgi:hypothetical protein